MTPTVNPPEQSQTPRKRKISMRIPSGKTLKRLAKTVKNEVRELVGLAHHVTPPIMVQQGTVPVVPLFGSLSFPSPPSSPSRRKPSFVDTVAFVEPPPPLTIPASSRSRTSSATLSVDNLHLHKTIIEVSESDCSTSITVSSLHTSYSETDSDSYHLAVEEATIQESPTPVMEHSPRQEEPASHVDAIAEPESDPLGDEIPTSPPQVYVEPPVPDPFLVDDPEDPMSDEENPTSESQQTIVPTRSEEILINPPASASPSLTQSQLQSLPPSDVNKDVPPQPQTEEEEDEEEVPEISLPGLVLPTMFLPIPNTDPLTTLLTKYIPPEKRPARDLTGEWQRSDYHTLVMSNSWRALARMARDRIVTTDPEEISLILSLWYIRLASLARLRLFNQTSAECTNLFSVLNAIEPPSTQDYVFERILPFELEVMYARLKYWVGDHMGYLDALNGLLRKCRTNAKIAKDEVTVSMWKERGARMCMIIASQLIEMKDFLAATKLLEPLCTQDPEVTSPALRSSIARIYLQAGCVKMAEKHFDVVEEDPTAEQTLKDMNAALLASANGDWESATNALRRALKEDGENYAAVNDLSVALFSQGKVKEAIEILETALKTSPSAVVVAEPFLFNLSTLYELRSGAALDKKRELLAEVAKWSGDGLKTACLKMPTS